jgi:hypothetical protein
MSSTAELDQRISNLLEQNRSDNRKDYGLATEIVFFSKGEDFNGFFFLTDKLLEECQLHTRGVIECLELK